MADIWKLARIEAQAPTPRAWPEPPPAVAPELDGLLRACFTNPKHNLPRLVLADYLEERGETDRATILRIQCELPLPKKGEKPKLPRGAAKPLAEATKRLFAQIGTDFAKLHECAFRRGFLSMNLGSWFYLANRSVAFTQLMRSGWVETAVVPDFDDAEPEVIAALRQVGVIDLSHGRMSEGSLLTVATELRPGLPDSRVQRVIVQRSNRDALARLLGTPTKSPAAPVHIRKAIRPGRVR